MIKFVIEIVIAFVIQAWDQINFTIASSSEADPLSLCMYMHRSTLVYINVSIGCFGSKWSGRLQVDPWIVLPRRAFVNNGHLTDSWIVATLG